MDTTESSTDASVPTKKCGHCKQPLALNHFYRDKNSKDGRQWICKACRKIYIQRYAQENSESIAQYQKKYRADNAEHLKQSKKIHYENDGEHIRAASRERYAKKTEEIREKNRVYARTHQEENRLRQNRWNKRNPEKVHKSAKRYRERNPENVRTRRKQWALRNPDKRRAKDRQRRKKHGDAIRAQRRQRYAADLEASRAKGRQRYATPTGKINARMSIAIRRSLHSGKGGKPWEEIVGYTAEQLRQHIERQFTDGMSWAAFMRSEIHIDHIIPRKVFTFTSMDDVQFKACWALSNLRPLWKKDNLAKSGKLLEPFQQYLL